MTTPDDVRFLDHLIDDAIATFGVDPHRIYMGGYSGGAMLTLRSACEVLGRIAGIALVGVQMYTTIASKSDNRAQTAPIDIYAYHEPPVSLHGNPNLLHLPTPPCFCQS